MTLEEIRKALKDAGAEDEVITKALGEAEGEIDPALAGDEGEGADEQDVAGDFLKSLFKSVNTVIKSKTADKDAALKDVFQNAYEELGDLHNQIAEFSFGAGAEDAAAAVAKAKKQPPAADPEDAADGGDDEDTEDMEKVLKSVSPKVGAFVKSLTAANTTLAKRVNALEAERDEALFKSRAKAIGEGEEFAGILKTLAKADPKAAEALEKALKTKNEAIRKGKLFGEVGGDAAEGGASAVDQLGAKAAEIVAKSNGKILYAKAFTQACNENPDLYREHRREQSGR